MHSTLSLTIEQIEDAIIAHESYYERAKLELLKARTTEEVEQAHWSIANASAEIYRWQKRKAEAQR